jgi:hypothetical protein
MAEGNAIVLIMDNAPYHRRIEDEVPRAKNFNIFNTTRVQENIEFCKKAKNSKNYILDLHRVLPFIEKHSQKRSITG